MHLGIQLCIFDYELHDFGQVPQCLEVGAGQHRETIIY